MICSIIMKYNELKINDQAILKVTWISSWFSVHPNSGALLHVSSSYGLCPVPPVSDGKEYCGLGGKISYNRARDKTLEI